MASNEGKYNIKAISNMLGIQAGTLRAWERRYQIIEPVRNQAGHRLYTDEHVSKLKWLIDKVNKGFTIGQAVGLMEKGEFTSDINVEAHFDDKSVKMADDILSALLKFEESKAQELLNHAFSLFSIEKVAVDILGKLLVKVGNMWERGEITVAHEHYISAFLRTRIGNVFHGYPIDSFLPKVVAVCGPNETHEIGLLIFMLYLRQKGFEVIYIGAGVPKKDVQFVLEEVEAKFFFTSCTMVENLKETIELIDMVDENFSEVVIGVGGGALKALSKKQQEDYKKYMVGNTKEEWEQWLSKFLLL
ncbi:MerR family transcriptional regulator [Bacillus sp. FJAT-45350]|uniref:MerR family transcriptional regulator n=1 Tax=Bacillus sp. FJAT-45350 TaxID=2011014 RepID=UPI000BB8F35C|nr:MerR family transcriptional regulator [Bacillus sp. FJAT-45350]